MDCVSCYLNMVLDPAKRVKTIRRIVRHLKPIADTFDVIAIRGMSGALIGPAIADKLKKPIMMVRKNDRSHSYHKVEGVIANRYLILDDTICSGNTMRKIVRAVKKENKEAQCVGIYLYADGVYPGYRDHIYITAHNRIPVIINAKRSNDWNDETEGYSTYI